MTAWFRLDAGTIWDARVISLGSDEVRWAYVEALCFAKLQSPEGVFQSAEQYATVTRRPTTTLDDLVGARLVERHQSGSLWIAGWDELQGLRDKTGAKRQRAWRQRQNQMRDASRNALPNETETQPIRYQSGTKPRQTEAADQTRPQSLGRRDGGSSNGW
jgi:hypothetical protein